MNKKRVGVLISGRGSNMRALFEAGLDPKFPAEVVFVASNNPQAEGLEFAKASGLSTAIVDHRQFAKREEFDDALHRELSKHELDIVCCAGFMRIMTPRLIVPWSGRMLNIHPSLLPLYKGLHTHERALGDGAKIHGATVHFVSEELDGGEIILQKQVPVFPDDTPTSLSDRVLSIEHALYVEALALVASGHSILKY
jgi:phosphoribosylglycinamide formyltransferase 1